MVVSTAAVRSDKSDTTSEKSSPNTMNLSVMAGPPCNRRHKKPYALSTHDGSSQHARRQQAARSTAALDRQVSTCSCNERHIKPYAVSTLKGSSQHARRQ
ncbi:hypothetical protein EVAR_74372_1 [Eumeta japonica]|uniref:Uncharacterized protein n=1 Tax=Eumeta variegata TaxID=151549 RepID=A0A4C1SDE0_EUMVA|nr:hypothetical protein EVAR_74372_1 [Eumeta japonica]